MSTASHDDFVTGICTTCGMEVAGTVDHIATSHVPRCREIEAVSRAAFHRVPWPDLEPDEG